MKRIYLVADTLLGRDVAFALIESAGLDEADRKRVLQEAQTMARLGEHPNIVPIYELGEERGQPYLVLPLMAGGTVGEVVDREDAQGVPIEMVMRIAQDVCRGLELAHSKGVVHRDLKPSNVWLTADGAAKIGDFWIAFPMTQTRMTDTGRVIGTVQYMSPESAMGGEINEHSDLYSLGPMLYELVAGSPPFQGSHPVAIISQHVNVMPLPPSRSSTDCPPGMVALILRLLAKEPSDRPQSATEVLRNLETIANTGGDQQESRASLGPHTLRVLHVEDSEDDAMLVLRELREAEERRARRKAEHEERRLHGELEKRNRELELLVKGLSMPNAQLEERLTQHLEALRRLAEDARAMVEDARNAWAPGKSAGAGGK